ncbi:MAG: hypothetical protein OXD49_17040 [Candidatus Poribacteria bacterium]|nr:hypothetical protein [Candidatus Poribacteria bacterium]
MLRVFVSVITLLILALPVYAQQIETRLSDALFYEQIAQQPVNVQAQNNVVIVSRKDPFIAGALSFLITGLGQVYNGEIKKGFFHFATAVSGYTLYFLADGNIGIAGLLVGVGTAVWSVIDAPLSANRINRENEYIRQHEAIPFSISPTANSNNIGAALTLRW